jgi:hypothetical protein
MRDESVNGRARGEGEQGVTYASLRFTLSGAHCVRTGEDGDGESAAPRRHCVSARMNEDELAQLRADARARHQRMGAVLREHYFGGAAAHVPPANVEKWEALAAALGNLQRLALALNMGQLPGDVRPALAAAVEEIHALRADLVGQRQVTAKGENDDEG